MQTECEPAAEPLQNKVSDTIARHDCQHRLFERDRDVPSQSRASQRRAADAGDGGDVNVAGFLIGRFEEFLHALIFVDVGRSGRVDQEQ